MSQITDVLLKELMQSEWILKVPFQYHFLGQNGGFKAARNIIKPATQASNHNGVCKDLLSFLEREQRLSRTKTWPLEDG